MTDVGRAAAEPGPISPPDHERYFRGPALPPSVQGVNQTTWKRDDLRPVLMGQGIDRHRATIRKILKEAGYRWCQARVVLTSSDPEYRETLKRMTAILSGLKPGDRFFSIDEFGPFPITMRAGRVLARPGQDPSVPKSQKSKGRLILTTRVELSAIPVADFFSARKHTGEMLRRLDRLLVESADCDQLDLSWDAASWHDSQALPDRGPRSMARRTGRATPPRSWNGSRCRPRSRS